MTVFQLLSSVNDVRTSSREIFEVRTSFFGWWVGLLLQTGWTDVSSRSTGSALGRCGALRCLLVTMRARYDVCLLH